MVHISLIIGLIFPLISLLYLISIFILAARSQKTISGVWVPFVGPLFINVWQNDMGHPGWSFIMPWVLDAGTIVFIIAVPRLFLDFWKYSSFTRVNLLKSSGRESEVTISIHKSGLCLFKQDWKREKNKIGVISVSEPCKYHFEENRLKIMGNTDSTRILQKDGTEYKVIEDDSADNYNIKGWVLNAEKN